MDQTSSKIALLVPAPAEDPHSAQPEEAEPPAEKAKAGRIRRALSPITFLSRVAVIGLIAYGIAPRAWRARGDPVELAAVVAPCALLAALYVCQHRIERLTPESPPEQRWLLHAADWVLTAAMIWLLWYQAPEDLQAALAITGLFTVLAITGLFVILLVLRLRCRRRGQQYQELKGVDSDAAAAGDGKDFKAVRPAEDLV